MIIVTCILMPLHLDENDVAIIKSLLNDGRKSFRQISRDTGITTPTVKARFERLVNVGFIKGVFPIFDFSKVNNNDGQHRQQPHYGLIQIQNIKENATENENAIEKGFGNVFEKEVGNMENKITNGLAINIVCDFCEGPVYGNPKVLKFADIERFFCCNSCRSGYGEKYRGRIESIKRKYEGKSEIDI
jgi:Lrp/AsnC family leucine-responsive transcriptional regulator